MRGDCADGHGQTICRMYMNDCGKPKMSDVGCPTCYLARYPHDAVHRG